MKTERKHYVTFLSPGTLFSETTTKPIESWDPKLAVAMAEQIVERYNARPYAFQFETRIEAEPVSDGAGGTLRVEPKTIAESGRYFLGAKLETVDEVEARRSPDERVLLSNMQGNGYHIVATTTNGYRSTQPFRDNDNVVDASGNVTERGDDPRHVAYRAEVAARKP